MFNQLIATINIVFLLRNFVVNSVNIKDVQSGCCGGILRKRFNTQNLQNFKIQEFKPLRPVKLRIIQQDLINPFLRQVPLSGCLYIVNNLDHFINFLHFVPDTLPAVMILHNCGYFIVSHCFSSNSVK